MCSIQIQQKTKCLLVCFSILIICIGCSTTYHGMVKDSQTGSAIEDAVVEGRYATKKLFALNSDTHIVETTTNSEGKFRISIPDEPIGLYVKKHGYDPIHFDFSKWTGKPLELKKWDPEKTIIIELKKWQE